MITRFAVVLCTTLLASFAVPASAWNRLQATQFATLPSGTAHPEGITADARGNLYVADFDVSGNTSVGTIVVFDRNGRWLRTLQIDEGSAMLLGIAFNPATGDLLVCDLGKSQVLRVADGLIIDAADNLWVAANQADEIVVVDPTGRVIAKLGDFGGIDRQGAPVGLLFPASLVMVENFLYVTNLSLDLRAFNAPAVDSQWAAQVTRHTIARIPAHLPPIRGD